MSYSKGDSFSVEGPLRQPNTISKDWRKRALFGAVYKSVFCIDRESGQTLWEWTIPKIHGNPNLLLEDERLIINAGGYLYCLDAGTGEMLWQNALKGKGIGSMALISPRITIASNVHSNE